ncbi:MAG: ribbon-helix-helix protein, CopG family [Actinomycetota bacterium]|nr:ribbon-helix-helix protein, CopG family [Actinomycetota bacterium]
MRKTTVYLPDELKAALERAAAEERRSEAELIREAISVALRRRTGPRPRPGLVDSGDTTLAERVEELLEGFGAS